jgi:hypothetical protein
LIEPVPPELERREPALAWTARSATVCRSRVATFSARLRRQFRLDNTLFVSLLVLS